MIGFLFTSPSFSQIVVGLHADWDPDLTDNQPGYCVTFGTVAAPHFHFVAAYNWPVMGVSVDWIEIKEVTNAHTTTPEVYIPDTDTAAPPEQCASLLGINDPQNWSWVIASVPIGAGAFTYHNTTYQVTAQYRYMVMGTPPPYPPPMQEYGPYQVSISVDVQNMVVTSGDVGKVLSWDPERPEVCDTTFGYAIQCAQKKPVEVSVSIYSMDGFKVYEVTEQKMCPGSYSFTWDGTVNMMPPAPDGLALEGLYTFDVGVVSSAQEYDSDWVRSRALTVEPGPVEYFGYDDGGTPEDETDDNYLYYIRWYRLTSGRDSSYGEIWLYDPDFLRVQSWAVSMLECIEHGYADGLRATPGGLLHGVIVRVPVSAMEKAGTHRFVLHFSDDYADSYKNHQVKAALELNQSTTRERLDIWVCTLSDSDFREKIHWGWIYFAFETVAKIIPVVVQPDDTAGQEEAHWLGIGRGSVKFRSLSARQKRRACRRTVIVMGYPSGSGDHPCSTAERGLSPDNPALSIVFTNVVDQNHPRETDPNAELMRKNGYTNVLIHELTHVANDNDRHCPQSVATCIWRSSINRYFFDDHSLKGWYNQVRYKWKGEQLEYYSPWHSLSEINEMRKSMRLFPLR